MLAEGVRDLLIMEEARTEVHCMTGNLGNNYLACIAVICLSSSISWIHLYRQYRIMEFEEAFACVKTEPVFYSAVSCLRSYAHHVQSGSRKSFHLAIG